MHRHNDPLPISVIIPVRDRAALLRETLDSIDAQTARPAQIVVVDDGSSDGSGDVARERGATVVRTPGYGVSTARNLGIDRADQPWVAFCDSDDLWEPEKLAAQWTALQAAPRAGFCFTDSRNFGEGEVPGDALATSPAYRSLKKRPLPVADAYAFDDDDFERALARANFCCMGSSLIARRDFAVATGFDATMRYAEDYDFVLRLKSRTSAIVVERPLVRIRFHDSGASRKGVDMALGELSLVEKAQRRPDRYPPRVPEALRGHLWTLHRRAAMEYLRAGDMPMARRHLRFSLRRHLDSKTLVALAALSVAPSRAAVYVTKGR